ncbi:PDZ and LIM domain 7, isoform CRA_b, partial [Rattus norvegicus]
MSWSYRAHAIHVSGTGTTSALPTCSTCSPSLALLSLLPSAFFSLTPSQGTPRVPPALTYCFHSPGLNLLLAWSRQPVWHRAWLRLTLPSFLALWYCCLPGLRCLERGNKHSQSCF